MKHQNQQALTRSMARLLVPQLLPKVAPWNPTLVVPVPMHWRRRWIRGINSPDWFARTLAQALGVPMDDHLLIRFRFTKLQSELSPSARKQNVQGAFRLRDSFPLLGARILLVDDVLTTGATCGEIAKLLKQAGATAVWVAVLARTPPCSSL